MTLALLIAAAAAAAPPPDDTIVVTGSLEPVQASPNYGPPPEEEELHPWGGLPMIADVLRLTPAVSVAASGPRGTQTQIRMRGAEANHTLLIVDGIRFNDPAAGNEARFELLTNDAIDRIDILRGPYSAYWGSEAIGGVIQVFTNEAKSDFGADALAEYGSLDSARASVRAAGRTGKLALGGSAGRQASDGIDSFGAGGDRDGFENRTAAFKAVLRPTPDVEIGAVGHWIEGRSEFDGVDPVGFRRADTLDETGNRIGTGRMWGKVESGKWIGELEASLLDSANRNRLADAPLNSTFGRRFTAGAELSRLVGSHRLSLVLDHQAEDFRARDQVFFGGSDQDRSRDLLALLGEWHAEWSEAVTTDIAVRHDRFSAFRDATTVHVTADVRPIRDLRVLAGYSEGVAQPTFYDLYGFFPGSFIGNPALRPERAHGWHAWLRWRERRRLSLGLGLFRSRLEDEIVDVFDPASFRSTTANAVGGSRRRGIELEGEWRLAKAANFSFNYTWLDSEERRVADGLKLREIRRPRHSLNLMGHGRSGPFSWGAAVAYVGDRGDTDFDVFPARPVTLDDYVLASFRFAWRISPRLEAYVRAENAFADRYQDVVGYRTAGRTAYAGLRLRFRD